MLRSFLFMLHHTHAHTNVLCPNTFSALHFDSISLLLLTIPICYLIVCRITSIRKMHSNLYMLKQNVCITCNTHITSTHTKFPHMRNIRVVVVLRCHQICLSCSQHKIFITGMTQYLHTLAMYIYFSHVMYIKWITHTPYPIDICIYVFEVCVYNCVCILLAAHLFGVMLCQFFRISLFITNIAHTLCEY